MAASHWIRFERVDAVEETGRGLLATLHGERLRVDFVRDDVVRVKISRGGAFDEEPTSRSASTRSPTRSIRVRARRRRGAAPRLGARGVAVARAVPARRPPRRRQRRGGDRRGRRALGLRHAQRHLRDPSPLPPGGRDLRARREDRQPQPQRPRLHALEHRRARPRRHRRVHRGAVARRPARGPHERRVRPLLRLDPVLLPPGPAGRDDGGLVHRQRLPRDVRLLRGRGVPIRFEGGQYTEYIFAGPDMAGILAAYTWLTGRAGLPPLWALGYHQCRWFHYTQDAVEALAAAPPRARRPVRRAVARHRVHGRLPRLHLGHGEVPRAAGHARPPRRGRLPGHHDHRPGLRRAVPLIMRMQPELTSPPIVQGSLVPWTR